jgi:hypothetical protein
LKSKKGFIMSERELAEQSEIFYYALVTSRAASVLAEFERSGELPPNGRGNLQQCHQLMKRIARAQSLVEARTEKIVPDLESIQLYQSMLEAIGSREILEPGESLGQAANKFSATLEAVLAGKPLAEMGQQEFDRLRKAVSALASVYANRTAVTTMSRRSRSLLELPL